MPVTGHRLSSGLAHAGQGRFSRVREQGSLPISELRYWHGR